MTKASQQNLLPAYLVIGEDALKRRTVLDRLRKRVGTMGDLEFNHDEFDGANADGGSIAASCNTLPFASDIRLVEVTNVDKLKKQDAEVLVAYLAAPNVTTVLALSGEKLAKNSRLYKAAAALGKSAVIDCAPMKRYELARALREMAVGHGFTMTSGAAEKLIELVGEDTIRLDSELRKLALAHKGTNAVGEREVQTLVARTTEAKPWEFVDAFASRDAKRCLLLRGRLDSTTPYALMAMCVNRLRELCCAKSLAQRGQSQDLPTVLKVPAWRVKNHATWARGFSDEELRKAFTSARECEKAMKSGSDPERSFERWYLGVIAR